MFERTQSRLVIVVVMTSNVSCVLGQDTFGYFMQKNIIDLNLTPPPPLVCGDYRFSVTEGYIFICGLLRNLVDTQIVNFSNKVTIWFCCNSVVIIISAFNEARGYNIERDNYITDLMNSNR